MFSKSAHSYWIVITLDLSDLYRFGSTHLFLGGDVYIHALAVLQINLFLIVKIG